MNFSLSNPMRFCGSAPLLALLAVLLPLAERRAEASELAHLRNGFDQRCHHHALVDGHLRLYLSPSEGSFLDLHPSEVEAFEQVSDPEPPMPAAANSDHKIANPASAGSTLAASKPAVELSKADLAELLNKAGGERNLDVDLLASLVKAESGGNAHAVSRTGARGLMQLMPATAANLGVHDSFEPSQNVRGGSAYLDSLLARYHENLALALAAYNAGPAAVDKYHGIPPYAETRAYVAHVIHEFNRRVLAREAERRQASPKPVANAAAPNFAPTRTPSSTAEPAPPSQP